MQVAPEPHSPATGGATEAPAPADPAATPSPRAATEISEIDRLLEEAGIPWDPQLDPEHAGAEPPGALAPPRQRLRETRERVGAATNGLVLSAAQRVSPAAAKALAALEIAV